MQQSAAINRPTNFYYPRTQSRIYRDYTKIDREMTSPFNEERNELEFMWSGDKLTRDRDGRCQTHNPLISPPFSIGPGFLCGTALMTVPAQVGSVARILNAGAWLGSARVCVVHGARAGAVCAMFAPRRLSLDCRHGNSIFLTFPPRLASPRSNCTPHE